MIAQLRCTVVVALIGWAGIATAAPTTLDFEGLVDSDVLSTEFPGLTFTHAMVLRAGVSLNEFDFPPKSGLNVVTDDGGPIIIDFAAPVTWILAYLTYAEPVTLRLFDAALTEIANVTSAYTTNLASGGDPGSSPNEEISLALAGGFTRAVFEGNAVGGSYVLDDLTYDMVRGVPEPSSLALALLALVPLSRSARRAIPVSRLT